LTDHVAWRAKKNLRGGEKRDLVRGLGKAFTDQHQSGARNITKNAEKLKQCSKGGKSKTCRDWRQEGWGGNPRIPEQGGLDQKRGR